MTLTVYYDVSELLLRGLNTGIQRVVRQIARASTEIGPEFDIQMVPVLALGDRFHLLAPAGTDKLFTTAVRPSEARLTNDTKVTRLIKRGLARLPSVYEALSKIRTDRQVRRILSGLANEAPVEFLKEDTILLLDSFWGGCTAVDAAVRAAATGCRIIPVIYDMIPVSHPQFCESRLPRAFIRQLEKLFPVSTQIMSISRFSASEVQHFLSARGLDIPVAYFYLGADLDQPGSSPAPPRAGDWPDGLLEGDGRIFVMVGTLEPRKGHAAVLDAFERLWASSRQDKLLLIGKIGWDTEAFLTRCAAHPEVGRRLFLVHGATDAMLATAFDMSFASILASTIEGFGLPLVEALHRGVPVVASDIPAFREIGTDGVTFFSLGESADLARVIETIEDDRGRDTKLRPSFEWIDWHGSARQLLLGIKPAVDS
ncbi:glycosyltransferase family 4 protein [Glacieibacterium sp.]|uniref:glycosyltransferase family 4 protein n=1 Tax=Glacieibacterium sp. TaxID=2860237 RepID=UPI003B00AF4E